jgi:hypothetical protein
MAVTMDEIRKFLDEAGLKYQVRDKDSLMVSFRTETYRRPDGEQSLLLAVLLEENGEYFKLIAPKAFVAHGAHMDAFFRACMMVQWQTKFVQFEYDESDGEIRPIIEFPLEDAKMTRRQLERSIQAMCRLLEQYYAPLKRALETGAVELEATPAPPPGASALMAQMLLASLKAEGRTDSDPQVVALQALIASMGSRAAGGSRPPDAL